LDDVETFIIVGNFKEIPVVSVSLPLVRILLNEQSGELLYREKRDRRSVLQGHC
jgi:hypothetical protein